MAAGGNALARVFRGRRRRLVGLTAREAGLSPTGLAGESHQSLTNGGPSLIGPHKSSISRPKQKLRIDQGAQKRITGGTIEAPQPLRLRRCQAKSRHLDVLTLDTPQHVVMRLLRCHIRCFSQVRGW